MSSKKIWVIALSPTLLFAPNLPEHKELAAKGIEVQPQSKEIYVAKRGGNRSLADIYKESDVDAEIDILEAFKKAGQGKTPEFRAAVYEVINSANWNNLSPKQQRAIRSFATPIRAVLPVFVPEKSAYRTLEDIKASADADDTIQILTAFQKAKYGQTQEFRDAVIYALGRVNWNVISETQQKALIDFANLIVWIRKPTLHTLENVLAVVEFYDQHVQEIFGQDLERAQKKLARYLLDVYSELKTAYYDTGIPKPIRDKLLKLGKEKYGIHEAFLPGEAKAN